MRTRILLLGGQALCLGLSSALLIVAATSVFLTAYGAQLLPYAYIAVALGGVAVSWAMGRVQRRLSLAGLATTVLVCLAVILAVGWAVLVPAGQTWVTFPLVVLVFLWIPVGFLLVGSQSGRLLDIQQLKAWFPRIAAGFAAGFGIGGLLSARLVTVLGGPEGLLLVDVFVVLVFLVLVLVLAHHHPAELRRPPDPPAVSADAEAQGPSWRRLLDDRLVVVLLGYQLLSAAVTQLLDYLVWSSAAERYPDPDDLARFLGLFGAVINIVGLVFVFTLAGFLLSRYGVLFGLAANPAGVVILVVLTLGVGLLGGVATTAFFLLICAQQVVDITLTDGTTRGSINAAYQALPPRQRLAAQTRVEGLGVPAAVGAVGVLLLVAQAVGASVLALLIVVLVLTVVWLVLAVVAFRLYGANLRRTITRRSWDPVALRLDDAASREVVQKLLASADPRDVAVALDALAATSSSRLAEAVDELLRSPDSRRVDVGLEAARRHRVYTSVPALLGSASDTSLPAELRTAALCGVSDLGAEPEDIEPLLQDPSDAVALCAAVALIHLRGSDEDVARVNAVLDTGGGGGDQAAAALAQLPSPAAVPALLRASRDPHRLAGLVDALSAHAAQLAPATAASLADRRASAARRTSVLVRALAAAPTSATDALLLDHLLHPSLDVREAVLDALTSSPTVAGDERLRAAVSGEVERVARCLDAAAGVGEGRGTDGLRQALRDDLAVTGARVQSLLGLLHRTDALIRAVPALGGPERPLALETIEVTLGRADARIARAVLDPVLDDARRRDELAAYVDRYEASEERWLEELALDPDGRWHEPWLRACAVWASDAKASRVAGAAAHDDEPVVRETAAAVLAGHTAG